MQSQTDKAANRVPPLNRAHLLILIYGVMDKPRKLQAIYQVVYFLCL